MLRGQVFEVCCLSQNYVSELRAGVCVSAFSAGEDTPVCNVHEIGSVNLKVLPALAMLQNLGSTLDGLMHVHPISDDVTNNDLVRINSRFDRRD